MKHAPVAGLVVGGLLVLVCAGLPGCPAGGGQAPESRASADRFESALRVGPVSDRARALASVLEEARDEDWASFSSIVAREISSLDERDLAQVVDAWVAAEPAAAHSGVESWPYPLKREIGLHALVRSTAVRDSAAGIAMFETITKRYPRLEGALRASLIEGWAHSDREGLLEHLSSLSPEEIGPPLGAALGPIARFHGLSVLAEWTEELILRFPSGPLRAKIFRKAVRTTTRRDPAAAVAWWERHRSEAFAEDAPDAIAEAWILISPHEAIEWLQTAAPRERRARSLEIAFGRWLYEDQAEATAWLASGARTEFKDPAAAVFARQLVRRDPAAAVEECGRIVAAESRVGCWVSVARGWLRRDAEGARAWLESSPLDRETRDAVLSATNARATPDTNDADPGRRLRAARRGR